MRVVALLLSSLLLLLPALAVFGDLPTRLNDEVLGLIVFKSGLQDPTSALSSWNEDDDTPCSWAHLQCEPSAPRVLRLTLDSLSLSGDRLPRGLDRLPALQSLSLSRNALSGDLSPDLSLLSSLRSLDLSHNSLTNRIPADLGRLSFLRSLDLSANFLSGPIPDLLFSPSSSSSLRYLDLSGNRLEGPLPATLSQCGFLLHLNLSGNCLSGSPDLWSLSRLRVLDLSANSFTGAIPEAISALHNLNILRLNGNSFSGVVPAGVGLCRHLTTLDLSYNSFNGAFPDSIKYLSSLSHLSLSNNKLSGDIPPYVGVLTSLHLVDLSANQLTGAIPASLGTLRGLTHLILSENMLTGEIPASISGCASLKEVRIGKNRLNGSIPEALFDVGMEVLDLSSNALVGRIPAGSSKLAGTLAALDLSDNRLTGAIPAGMALYFNLRYLNLSWNDLRTRLPPELGYFRNLSVLDLRNSTVYGPIPPGLCDSGSIAVLQLDGNSLTGPIPEAIGNCSSLYLLSLSRNGLSGAIPAAMTRLKKLEILKLEFNSLSGEIPLQLGGLESLLAVNISHNRLIGRLPVGGVFPSLDGSALQGNLGLCTPLVTEPCKMNVPKPLVLDPNAYLNGAGAGNGDSNASVSVPKSPSARHRRFLSVSAIIAISAALVIALGVLVVTLLNVSARRRIGLVENALESMCTSSTKSGGPAVGKMVLFGPRNLLRTEDLVGGAEALLSKAVEMGRGVFGAVYRVPIGEGRVIAIKRLISSNIVQHHEDFDREVRILGKAKHPNLMPLKGYYWTPQLQLLISDYAPHGSLHTRLHQRPASTPALSWSNRFKVVFGTARGLAHLHQSFRPPIIHYNIKPHNILLDEHCNPMVSDFGLAKLLPKLEKHVISSRFQSAMGYVAPELACQSLRINEKCDVYGFGVLVLELVTGRRAVEYGDDDVVILIDQVRALLEQGNALECVDPAMGEFPEEEVLPVLKLGMVCTSQIPSSRPSMAEVVQILQVIKTPVLERMGAF